MSMYIPNTAEQAYLRPREPFAIYLDRLRVPEPRVLQPSKPQYERLELAFDIPFEEDTPVNCFGKCGCDICQMEEEKPVKLYRGMTAFRLDGKLIYCDCLYDYLKSRMVILD